MLNDAFGLIYAGEQNMKLIELVSKRAIGALPIGGRYRAIDFQLSNMVNSGIRNVGVVAEKNYHSLMDHLGSGKEWDLNRKNDGLFILPPFDTAESRGSFRGLCDAVKNSMSYIHRAKQQYCLLTGSYTIYNMTYNDLIDFHIEKNADVTILYNEEKGIPSDADRFKDLRLYFNEDGLVTDMEFNSMMPNSSCVGMDAYLLRKDLLEYLVEDALSRGKYSFVSDVLMPNVNRLKIYGYKHEGYVGRLTSVASYFKLNMDMINIDVQRELFHTGHPIYTKIKDAVPAKYDNSANVKNSIVANGCVIEGHVENCVLFRSVYIGKGSTVKDSVIMQDSEIYQNCWIENGILDKQVHVRSGRRLIGNENYPVIIKKGAVV